MNPINNVELINTWESNVNLELHSHFLPHSASFRDATIEILKERQTHTDNKIICIDWSKYSSNIQIINDENFEESDILLDAWIDWIILDTKKKAEIILPVADCWAIAAYHKSWNIIGLFHAWYKWVAWWENDLWIIANLIYELKNVSNSNNLRDFNFYISPMIWDKFELPKEYVEALFNKLFIEYSLDSKKYFLEHDSNSTKVYLHLRMLIKDVFKKYWIKLSLRWNKSNFDIRKTDSSDSIFPSYRLHSKYKIIQDKLDTFQKNYLNYSFQEVVNTKFELSEFKKKELKEKYNNYKLDYRLALILNNAK